MAETLNHFFFNAPYVHGNVVFNFLGRPVRDLRIFALAYHEAGRKLAAPMVSGTGYRDYDGYPILFLYRHALELYLKAIVYRGAMLLRLINEDEIVTQKLFARHDLTRLVPAIRAIFENRGWSFEASGLASFKDFVALISEIDKIDGHSYAFRFPIKTSGEANLPHHFVVNVVHFSKHMDRLLDFLDAVASALDEHWDIEAEVKFELQKLFASFKES
jgi:hypothetical protein